MVAFRWVIGTALAASTALANDFALAGVFIHPILAKRQNESVGSPSYNCHDNCGQAIIEVRNCNATICDDEVFQTNYKNCLQCAGPDNEDIWKYYGESIETAAASCGLDTEPLGGQQESVGTAVVASNSTSACEAAAAAGSESSSPSASASSTGASASASASASSSASESAASASGTASSAANAAPTAVAGVAAYGAVAVGALYAMGL
ncbi:hypothetical protein INS49_007335 [Diaporthe citri]|uniref:uncharacterized protein n=1 Tax=Diaporthe citri TaxID=83186 RepID=UPI001C80521E|nr:uncharacterized protein INS49_007335 [Diaporthe citri]KAG6365724.1 hypothetical protein INS49_007335 [Diaporthe citri]